MITATNDSLTHASSMPKDWLTGRVQAE